MAGFLGILLLFKCQTPVFADGRAIIQGVDHPIAAKNLYSKFIGM